MAEKDISPEQYEQLQKIQKMQAPGGEGGEDESAADADPPERMERRIKAVVEADGIRALTKLATGAAEATQDQVAMAFAQVRSRVPIT